MPTVTYRFSCMQTWVRSADLHCGASVWLLLRARHSAGVSGALVSTTPGTPSWFRMVRMRHAWSAGARKNEVNPSRGCPRGNASALLISRRTSCRLCLREHVSKLNLILRERASHAGESVWGLRPSLILPGRGHEEDEEERYYKVYNGQCCVRGAASVHGDAEGACRGNGDRAQVLRR